jgi:hypothetical protein
MWETLREPIIYRNFGLMTELPPDQSYTDLLLPVSEWPSLNVYYVVWQDAPKKEQSELRIGFVFDGSRYNMGGEVDVATAQKNAIDDLAVYTTTLNLLKPATGEQPDTKIIVTASLFETPSIILDAEQCGVMIGLAEKVCRYLQSKADDDNSITPLPPGEVALCFEITPALLNTKDIFEVEVQLEIQRDKAYVDAELPDIAGVCDVASAIASPAFPNDTGIDTIKAFAAAFEKALTIPGTQAIKFAGEMDEATGRIWAVRWGMKEGARYDIVKAPVYFAIPPLANIAVSRTAVPVCSYVTGKGLNCENVTAMTFTGIDMDLWGRTVVDAIETVLSPVYMVPASIAGKFEGQGIDYVQLLEDAKAGIANSIAASVTNVFIAQQPSAGQVSNAAACVKEQCLNNLRNAYTINAFVQFPVKVSSNYTSDDSPVLYGDVRGASGSYSLPATGILLKDSKQAGDQYLTVAFTADNVTDTNVVQPELSYQASHIVFTTDPGLEDSKRKLGFIIPPGVNPIAEVAIPVLLRSCPGAPVMVDQTAKPQDVVATIAQGKKWDYAFTYSCDHLLQDEVLVSLPFNVTASPGIKFVNNGQKDLFEALAQFVTVYPAIKKDLDTYLTQVSMETSKTDTSYINGIAALQAFTDCVQQVAAGWETWEILKNALPPPRIPAEFRFDFVINEPGSAGDAVVTLSPVETDIDGMAMPVIEIDPGNYEAVPQDPLPTYRYREIVQPGSWLSRAAAAKIPQRTVCINGLDILKFRSAQAAVSVRRNARFNSMATNDVFVYTTPYVRPGNAMLPLLDCKVPIDASIEGETKASLAEQVAAMLKAIFSNDASAIEVISMSCAYSYSMNPMLPPVAIPVLLAQDFNLNLPTDYNLPPGGCGEMTQTLVCRISAVLHDWFKMQMPSTDLAMFVFDITVFSGQEAGSNLPLLRFSNLQLPLDKINDMGKG